MLPEEFIRYTRRYLGSLSSVSKESYNSITHLPAGNVALERVEQTPTVAIFRFDGLEYRMSPSNDKMSVLHLDVKHVFTLHSYKTRNSRAC